MTLNMRKMLMGSAVAAAFALSSAASHAASNFSLSVNVGPPAPIYEVAPAPRPGYVWAQGYWDYNHGKHVWHKGYWERERHGERWAQAQWQERDGRWYLNRGHWER